jgi:hypothetical protein
MAGHLLECGAQVSGGYFADPGYKDVPDLAHLGFPIAQIGAQGECTLFKADHTGGLVSLASVKEQLLYEVHDPAAYITPDVVADISQATLHEVAPHHIALRGVRGHARTDTLKVNVCHDTGFLAEGEISYAGPRAQARALLAANILRQRLPRHHLRVDLLGAVGMFADDAGRMLAEYSATDAPSNAYQDIRLRVASACSSRAQAEELQREVLALYTCGPAGGGGVRTHLTPRLGTVSTLLPRDSVHTRFDWVNEEGGVSA